MLLFIDACVRKESRTRRLAEALIAQLGEEAATLRLADCKFPVIDEAFLTKRDEMKAEDHFEDPMFSLGRQFAEADTIVIAAPYWDLSFPTLLKQYFEMINVRGVTFRYTPEGALQGLCKAKKLYYVMTAGGTFAPMEYGFGYVKALAENFYGIHDVKLIQAVGLDLDGADPEQILEEAIKNIKKPGSL